MRDYKPPYRKEYGSSSEYKPYRKEYNSEQRPYRKDYGDRDFRFSKDKKPGEGNSMGFNRVDKRERRFKKKRMIRKKVYGTSERPRLVVFRSLKNVYGQLVDDTTKKTITTVSSRTKELQEELKVLPDKSQTAKVVGKALAKKALSLNIKKVVFDRNGYLYHGRVKALAEGAREGGLEF